MAIDVQAYSRLVGSLYAAAADPDGLDGALADIARVAGVGKASVINGSAEGRKSIVASSEMDAGAVESYGVHYGSLDRVVPTAGAPPVVFARDTAERLWPGFEKGAFCNEWSRPNGIAEIAFVTVPLICGGRSSLLLVASPRERGFGSADQLALLRLIEPHFRKMMALAARLRQAEGRAEHFFATLERLPYGVVVLDGRARVSHATAAAVEIMRADGALVLTARGLRAGQPEVDRALGDLVSRALGRHREAGPPLARALRVPRPSMAYPLLVHVVPLAGAPRQPGAPPADECAALVVIVDPSRAVYPTPDLVRIAFGLTRAEASVAIGVLEGHGLAAVADELGVSVSTVRTHLQRTFDKTGTRRQAELGRLIVAVAAGGSVG